MPRNSSSGVAVNKSISVILACTATAITQPLLDVMDPICLCTMVALFAFVTGNVALLAIKLRGPKWRICMDRELNARQTKVEK